ncbi:hypothetical protein CR513_61906, partial [Mucuna pruriens]
MLKIGIFGEDVREKMEMEFLELKQGNLIVANYAAKLEELSKYYPYYQDKARLMSALKSACPGYHARVCADNKVTCFSVVTRSYYEELYGAHKGAT